jgi:hypothetical protein
VTEAGVTRAALATICVAAAVALTAGSAARRPPGPTTVVTAAGPIVAFAQDGPRIAWISRGEQPRRCAWSVRVRTLPRGRESELTSAAGPTCRHRVQLAAGRVPLALAGRAALWALRSSGNTTHIRVVAGALGTRERRLAELAYANSNYEEGDHLGGLAGDGSTLAYSAFRIRVEQHDDCELQGVCPTVIAGGGVWRVVARAPKQLRAAPPAGLLAASEGRIVLAKASTDGTGLVEVRHAATGALVRAFSVGGSVRAVALWRGWTAVLVRDTRGLRIERRFTRTGSLVGTTRVPSTTAAQLSVFGDRIVFRVGRAIRAINGETGKVSTLARAASRPIGLSLEGRRLAWAENVRLKDRRRGRIRALRLPPLR